MPHSPTELAAAETEMWRNAYLRTYNLLAAAIEELEGWEDTKHLGEELAAQAEQIEITTIIG